jgi:hypothetical protein
MKYDPVRAGQWGRASILLAAQALCGYQSAMTKAQAYDLGNLLFEWLACTAQDADEDTRGWSAHVQGIPLDEVEEDARLAWVTARVCLGNGPERLGPLYFSDTEQGTIGVWLGPPGDTPAQHPNWMAWGTGDSATDALESMACNRVRGKAPGAALGCPDQQVQAPFDPLVPRRFSVPD